MIKKIHLCQHKIYSLLEINNLEISQERTRKLLIERLKILLEFKKYTREVEQIIYELFEHPFTRLELKLLLLEARKCELLESCLIKYIEQNSQWLQYFAIREQIDIFKQCRKLKTIPLSDKVNDFPHPVDVVYTWCDMEDPIFLDKFITQNNFDPRDTKDQGLGKHRYINNQEIKLALISLFKYFNKVNHVYIVTNDQQFNLDFLIEKYKEKVSFIDHSQILPNEYIRENVFSSPLIETFLWNIPNLNEHFLYFNDDMILGNYLNPKHLFDSQNTAFALATNRNYAENLDLDKLIDYHQDKNISWKIGWVNSIKQFILNNDTIQPFFNIHLGVFLLRSECIKSFHKYKDNWINSFFCETIRGRLQVYSLLIYVWEAVLNNNQKLGDYYEYNRFSQVFNNGLNEENLRYIREEKPLFYCVNGLPDKKSKKMLVELTALVQQEIGEISTLS